MRPQDWITVAKQRLMFLERLDGSMDLQAVREAIRFLARAEDLAKSEANSLAPGAARQLLFKVLSRVDGHEYAIYDNGDIAGFGPDMIVFNYYPSLLLQAVALDKEK